MERRESREPAVAKDAIETALIGQGLVAPAASLKSKRNGGGDSLLDVDRVCVDPLDGLSLLGDHGRELTEDGPELGDRGFNGLDRSRASGDVVVLQEIRS